MGEVRVVIDTNLWVAARFNPNSYSARILNLVGERKLELLWSADTRRELERILRNVKANPAFCERVDMLLTRGIDVGTPAPVDIIHEDPADNRLLECAQAGNADYLISNDEHLLSVRQFGKTHIVTPKIFLQVLDR